MKPDDKFPEEMLEDIREKAVKARDALDDLDFTIKRLSADYPSFRPALVFVWKAGVVDMTRKVNAIANKADELADAEEGGAE